jgi:hypothetical protein
MVNAAESRAPEAPYDAVEHHFLAVVSTHRQIVQQTLLSRA